MLSDTHKNHVLAGPGIGAYVQVHIPECLFECLSRSHNSILQ